MANLGSNGLRDLVVLPEMGFEEFLEDVGCPGESLVGLTSDAQVDLSWEPWVAVKTSSDYWDFLRDPTPDLGNRQATSNHKGVHRIKRNRKWAARLCLDSRKVDLGQYNTQYAASRAYQVGAFYYNKPLDTTSQSFVNSLPCIPDNLSDGEKQRWVRERARQYALTFDVRPASNSVLDGSNSSEARPSTPDSFSAQAFKSVFAGSSSLELFPNTPSSYGAHASYGNENSTTTSGSASELFRKARKEIMRFKRQKCVQTTSPDVELQQARNRTAHQALPHITNATDSILFALCELRKQGWNYRLERLSPSSVEAGVLFSLPQGQQTGPPLLMTDIIINSFYELREQGWEVRLEPCKLDEVNFPL